MTNAEVLGIDIGGSSIKAAPVNVVTGEFLAETVMLITPEPARPEDLASGIKEAAARFSWTGTIGVGYPGIVNNGIAQLAANVSEECLGADLKALFSARTGSSVHIINDADAAGLAEMKFGAGRDHSGPDSGVVLMLTFGTGIGSALFLDGKLLPNTEFGHLQVEGREAEDMASAKVRKQLDLSWPDWTKRVNRVIAEYELLLSPDLIIFGGGVTDNFDKFSGLLESRAKLVRAHLQNDAGVLGAALAVPQE